MSAPAPNKVLMTADTVGGVWTFAMELCAALAQYGVEVTLLTMGKLPDQAQRAEASTLPNLRLVPTGYRLEWMQDCQNDVIESGRLLTQLAREFQPDVVHLNGYCHATLPFDAPVLLTAHSCVASWWHACRLDPIPLEWWRYLNCVSAAVRAADMLTAPTRSFLARFQELHGRARDAQAIWNGRNTAFFHSGEKKNAVLAAGRLWDDAKNIGILREVAPHVGAPIFVAGDKISPDTTSIDLTALNPLGRLGRTELAAQIADTAVFASPARYEPFGLTILEAALSSCALALGDIATLRELWDGAAIFADPDDAQGWRQALSRLTTDREYAAALGEKARERAQRYSSQQMAEGYWGAYQKLLSIPTGIGVAA